MLLSLNANAKDPDSDVATVATNVQKISSIRLDANDGAFYITGVQGWTGDNECKNAEYVFIRPGTSGYDGFVSMAMAAYMADKSVRFYGRCDDSENGRYFKAYYIILTD